MAIGAGDLIGAVIDEVSIVHVSGGSFLESLHVILDDGQGVVLCAKRVSMFDMTCDED